MIALITGIVGLITAILAWYWNPKRKLQAELEAIRKNLEVLYVKRDEALLKGDNDALTSVTADIARLLSRKNSLLR